MLHSALEGLQGSALGVFVRESGPWTYALVNLGHLLGIALLFGGVVLLDLRLLGVWRLVPLHIVSRLAEPLAVIGFSIAAVTGLALLSANATEYEDNPFIYIKMGAIAAGLANALVVNLLPAWRARRVRDLSLRERRQLAIAGAASLASWATAIAAGRLMGYW